METLVGGTTLSERFTLIRPLGSGSTGTVWLARDEELGEDIALKILDPVLAADAATIEQIKAECRNSRKLHHPNIARIYDFHRFQDYRFISMQYIDGEDLAALRDGGPKEIVEACIPVAEALATAHASGVIHRDVKPSNVRIGSDGRVYLTDFGIASAADSSDTGRSRGSRYSMSPQQIKRLPPRPADDLYGFGCMLYELLTGEPPFHPDFSEERVLTEPVAPLETRHPAPEGLKHLVLQLLAKSPEERPADMQAVRDSLEVIEAKLAVGAERPDAAVRIDPIEPLAQARTRELASASSSSSWTRTVAVASILLLLAAAIGVIFVLPNWVEERGPLVDVSTPAVDTEAGETTVVEDTTPRIPTPTVAELQQRALLRDRAETVRADVEELHERLQQHGAAILGGEDYYSANGLIETAETLMRQLDYTTAGERYSEALQRLRRVDASAGDVFAEKMTQGQSALDAGDSETALTEFNIALKIRPNDPAATHGLHRAENIDRVMELTQAGLRAEADGDLETAATALSEAVGLDADYEPAVVALARVEGEQATDAFGQAMSAGFAAMQSGNFKAARDAFGRARSLDPDSPAPREALAQVNEAVRLASIARYRQNAELFESRERWAEAAEAYGAVLELDSSIAFAQQGRQRANTRAQLDQQLEYHLANPERLYAPAVFDSVSTLVAGSENIEPSGPRIEQQRAQLQKLLRAIATPVSVVLESDNLTDVTVYRVGNIGRFSQRELSLRPGKYTIVGTRSGYRDVRHELNIEPGVNPGPLLVLCEEPI